LVTIFNDENPDHSKYLTEEISKLPKIGSMKYPPSVQTGNIDSTVADQLATVKLVPTFSFIDPFGYKGLSLGLVRGAIKDWGCDCVFFFNYNRINAGISNPIVDSHMNALFSLERADRLRAELSGKSPVQRESLILERLAEAIKELGGRYVLPFRFRNANGTRSTHHLIFVSKHVKGYEIMKDIMAKESSTHDDGVPSLEYSPADASTPLLFLLKRSMDQLRGSLLSTFCGQSLPMIEIYNQHHVDTRFIKRNYKDALLELERTKVISAVPTNRRAGGPLRGVL
jgi:three-Cys-motif partner protein